MSGAPGEAAALEAFVPALDLVLPEHATLAGRAAEDVAATAVDDDVLALASNVVRAGYVRFDLQEPAAAQVAEPVSVELDPDRSRVVAQPSGVDGPGIRRTARTAGEVERAGAASEPRPTGRRQPDRAPLGRVDGAHHGGEGGGVVSRAVG